MKTLYHASPYSFDKFEIPYNGLHFGTLESAIQAVEYKKDKLEDGFFYLYQVVLDISLCEDVFDIGQDWAEYLEKDTSKVYSYTNKYEPSTGKSYVVFCPRFIKSVESKEKLSLFAYKNKIGELHTWEQILINSEDL